MIKSNNIEVNFGDARNLLKEIPSNSVNLVITSPPYNIGKKYGKYKDKVTLDEWEDLIDKITKEVHRILTPDGSFFLNLSPIPLGEDKEIFPLPYVGYNILKKNNFFIRNIITWTFNNMQNCTNRLSGRYENIIWGVKDLKNYKFNLDEVRIPYITQNDKRLTGTGRNPTDVWYFDRVNNMVKKKNNLTHPTIYPIDMIERIIKMASDINDVVLDPFLGSGTTVIAAAKLGRKGVGIELDNKYETEIQSRINNEIDVVERYNAEL